LILPVQDGFSFLHEWRGLPAPRPPVLAISGVSVYLPEAVGAGASAALEKPFRIEALLGLLHDLLAGRATAPPPAPPMAPETVHALFRTQLDPGIRERGFDRFAARVARLFGVPICLISLFGDACQFWLGASGLPAQLAGGVPRDQSFCTHAVASRAALIIQDLPQNPFFKDNPLVEEEGLRFYAGVPVFSRVGTAVGTMCLIDRVPQRFSWFDLELLQILARRVSAELEAREQRLRPDEPASTFRFVPYFDPELEVLGRQGFVEATKAESSRAAERREPLAALLVELSPQSLRQDVERLAARFPRALIGRLGRARIGLAVPGCGADEARLAAAAEVGPRRIFATELSGFPDLVESALTHGETSLEMGTLA
ncbi:MAG: GAF domain-containing protein, partial [Myxococcales bacterium]